MFNRKFFSQKKQKREEKLQIGAKNSYPDYDFMKFDYFLDESLDSSLGWAI